MPDGHEQSKQISYCVFTNILCFKYSRTTRQRPRLIVGLWAKIFGNIFVRTLEAACACLYLQLPVA